MNAPPEGFQRLIEARQQFLNFLERRVESRAVAEDILQAAFVRGLEKSQSIRDDESIVAWFYRILRNAVIDHYRHRAAGERTADTLAHEFESRQNPGPEIRGEVCQCVLGLLDNLKPEYRDALKTVDIDDGSLNDLAGKAEISANNAAVRVYRAREALRKQVTTACGACATHGCLDCHCKR
jgi:RNA polymerase sigma-70 factor (ECF subfamily)